MPASSPTFVTLARLLRPQGRRGELLCDLLTDQTTQLEAGNTAFLVAPPATGPAATAQRVAIESQWMPTGKNAGRIVLKLAGCDSISDAEKLAGASLMIPASERPALDPDTFYVSDLVGSTLFDNGTAVGQVVDVEFATSPDGRTRIADAPPLLAVQLNGAAEDAEPVLIPFVRAQLISVDPAAHRIDMTLPEGLFDPT